MHDIIRGNCWLSVHEMSEEEENMYKVKFMVYLCSKIYTLAADQGATREMHCHQEFWMSQMIMKIFYKLWWGDMGLCLWCRNQNTIIIVGEAVIITDRKKCHRVAQTSRLGCSNIRCLRWRDFAVKGFCPVGVCSMWSVNKEFYFLVMQGLREAVRKKWLGHGPVIHGCCLSTMYLHVHCFLSMSFWQNM